MASLDTFASSLADLLDRQTLHEARAAAEGQVERDALDERLRLIGGWLYDPVGFLTDCIDWPDGQHLTDYQSEILTAVPRERKVSARGPHGLGKTTICALAVIWFALTRDLAGIDWKVATTAGGYRQLEKYLWPEIHKWMRRVRWDKLGRRPPREHDELLNINLKLATGAAFAVASNDPALIEGVHADHVLYVFDESKSIMPAVFDAAEGAFSAAGAQPALEAFALAFSTPGEPAGRFYEIHTRSPGLEDWWVRHVTVDEAVKAQRIAADWPEWRGRQWGKDSAVYANRVLGEFHSSDEDAVIPLAWVDAAVERWEAWTDGGKPEPGGRRVIGVDVARSGEDKTVLAIRQGDIVEELRVYAKQDTMVTVGKVGGPLNTTLGGAWAVVDTDGLGAGVTDRLREQGYSVVAFHAGTRCDRRDRSGELGFVNTRSAAWWGLRELLDPAYGESVALPPDRELIGDLTAPHWTVRSNSRIEVESRDSIIKRLGRSPDRGTAVMQAFWTPSLTAPAEDAVAAYEGMDSLPTYETSRW